MKRMVLCLQLYCMNCMTYQAENDTDKDQGAASEAGHEKDGGVLTSVLYVLYDLPA